MSDEAHISTDPTRKYGVTKAVSERARRLSPIDELQRAEERILAELVTKVHHDRMTGVGWPRITRHRMSWKFGELRELAPDDEDAPDEWHVRAWVRAVPK